ncbi:hypothetical protein [Streptomyces microflavus]|uniref:hypothetical protein n=1 Tax=Streptomyces microflavus TaxID=1919 RepID=UPI00340FDDAB
MIFLVMMALLGPMGAIVLFNPHGWANGFLDNLRHVGVPGWFANVISASWVIGGIWAIYLIAQKI